MSELGPTVAAMGYEIGLDALRAEVEADGGLHGLFDLLRHPDPVVAQSLLEKYGALLAASVSPERRAENLAANQANPITHEQRQERDLLCITAQGIREEDASAMLVALHVYRVAYPDVEPVF